jgi:protein phosphatase
MRDAAAGGFASAESVVAAINAANTAIHLASGGPSDQRGMGTTLTAVVPLAATANEPQRMVVANVGDSRVYLWRGGELKQVSADHSYVQELLSEGFISAAEARVHPRRNIVTRALGIEGDVSADSWTLPMLVGDRYVLCSDGLVDEVDDEQIASILRASSDAQLAADTLVAAANANGGRDNVTVVVVDVADDVPDSAATTVTTPRSDATTIGAPRSSRVRRLVAAFAAVVIVAASAIAVTGWYARGGYFVGFDGRGDDAVLVVFKGRPQQILWFSPTVRIDTSVTRAEVFPALAADIDDEPEYDSLAKARAYVESIRGVVEAQRDADETGS